MSNKYAAAGLIILSLGTIINFLASAMGFGYFFLANTSLSFMGGIIIWGLFNIVIITLGWFFLLKDANQFPPLA